jgi:hypothetical protein
MTKTLTIPDFNFAAFYYGEIVEALTLYKRANAPELTDESDVELSTQLMNMFALCCHLNNTLMDVIGNENTLPTAKLRETVRNMLRLIDYELSSATPSQVDIVYELSRVFTSQQQVVPSLAQVATKKTETEEAVFFESMTPLTIDRTDQLSYVLSHDFEADIYIDHTTENNSPTTPGDDWSPGFADEKDAIYFGHKQIMWDVFDITMTTFMEGIMVKWEFYDGNFDKTQPFDVEVKGSTLIFNLSPLFGMQNWKTTLIRVKLNSTGAYEDSYSYYSSGNYVSTGLLGQSSPSTDPQDYTIGSDWSELEEIEDDTWYFYQSGKYSFVLPQNLEQNWIQKEIDGKTAYWIRLRAQSVGGEAQNPVFQQIKMDADDGKHYVLRSTVQGKTQSEPNLGIGTGQPGQIFETSKDNFIWDSEIVTVDGESWTRVKNYLGSERESKHYIIKLGENDRASVVFGSGWYGTEAGKKPPYNSVIAITYRYSANLDGNVGYNKVVVDKTGLTFINKIWNPRYAVGWKEAEGSTEESLELAKVQAPASIRTRGVAISPDDIVHLTENFVDSEGASPYRRAKAIEEGFGPKTTELVVVAAGGNLASVSQLDALDLYFNGNQTAIPPVEKHLVANQMVKSVNYTQREIDITATVWGGVTKEQVENKLAQILQPEAKDGGGVNYLWEFGELIPISKINSEIFKTDLSISKVQIDYPTADIIQLTRELPVVGTLNITVINP